MTTPSGAALAAFGAFADELAAPGFELGRWHDSAPMRDQPGVMSMPFYELSDRGDVVVRALGGLVMTGFDWPTWSRTPAARALRDERSVLATATADDLGHLVTWLVRAERFSEGGLESAFESGLLAAIARRAGELAARS